jgi:hypothetical protein
MLERLKEGGWSGGRSTKECTYYLCVVSHAIGLCSKGGSASARRAHIKTQLKMPRVLNER